MSEHPVPESPAVAPPRLSPPRALLDEGQLPTTSEARLLNARRLIEDGAISVVTLDVFDTLLWRHVPRPTDAFVLLGADLAAAGLLDPDLSPAGFRRLRVAAEARARELRSGRGDGVEVTLEEIWQLIPPSVLRGAPSAGGVEHEVSLEERITHHDLDIAAFAHFAAKHGCDLALVSNTYLSGQQLARLVARPQLDVLRGARIFASSVYGVHKANGLWKVVLDELGVPADRILHVGDELPSDVEAPSELGIHTVHYRRLSPETAQVLERESTSPPVEQAPARHACDPERGDYGLTALRAKVGGRMEATTLPADAAVAWHYGATVLGPALTGFAGWVADHAANLGVSDIWCLMREGEFLADLVNRAGAGRSDVPPATPVWLSRYVTARATIGEASETELRRVLNRRIPPTVGEFLASLGVSPGEVPEFRNLVHERMDRSGLVDDIVGKMAASDHLTTRIVAESTGARRRLLRSLQPMLDAPEDLSVLVDLGWQGTIQRQLTTALRLAGIKRHLVGLYLVTNEHAANSAFEGVEVRGYLANVGEPADAVGPVIRSPEIIEQTCLATCGSLLDFDADGEPVLDGSLPDPEQVASKLTVQHGVRAFQREWVRYRDAGATLPPLDSGATPYLLEALRRSITHPTAAEARTLGAWHHDDNFGADLRAEVIPPRLGAYTPYLSPPDLLEMTMREAYWPLGLAAEYDPGLAAAAQAVLGGALDPGDFEARRRPGTASLVAACTGGPSPSERRPLRINRNGLSYVHFDLAGDGIQSVGFSPCDFEAVVSIDWIDLAMRIRGQVQPVVTRIEGAELLGRLIYDGALWLTDGLLLSTCSTPRIHIPMSLVATGEVYGVDFSAAMAVLALPAGSSARLGSYGADPGRSVKVALGKVRKVASDGGVGALASGAARFARRRLG